MPKKDGYFRPNKEGAWENFFGHLYDIAWYESCRGFYYSHSKFRTRARRKAFRKELLSKCQSSY